MLRASAILSVLSVVACVQPAPTYPASAYSSQPAYLDNMTAQDYSSQSADPEGAQPGYPQGYNTGYPAGYPAGTEDQAPYQQPQYEQQQYQPRYQQPYQQQYAQQQPPQAECKSAYGTTACGYNCVAAYGEVKCAAQPNGACDAAYGKVTCTEASQGVYGGYGG